MQGTRGIWQGEGRAEGLPGGQRVCVWVWGRQVKLGASQNFISTEHVNIQEGVGRQARTLG